MHTHVLILPDEKSRFTAKKMYDIATYSSSIKRLKDG